MSRYVYSLSDYRAVKKAKIEIDGITVLTGENGRGKSTLSRVLYDITKVLTEYELLIDREAIKKIKEVVSSLRRIDGIILRRGIISMSEWETKIRQASYHKDLTETAKYTIEAIKSYRPKLIEAFENAKTGTFLRKRLATLFSIENKEIDDLQLVENICQTLIDGVEKIVETAEEKKVSRSRKVFLELLANIDEELSIDIHCFNLSEDNIEMIERNRFNQLFTIKHAIYYKTYEVMEYLDNNSDFHSYLEESIDKMTKEERLLSMRFRLILSGGIDVDETLWGSKRFLYHRNDGLEIPLKQAATGLISFAYLARLLENGYLRKDTLLIIDEPEAHLHPKWIVEYARMLVLVQKQLGVKIVLSSHNPDMIAAIDSITRKEGVADRTNFYFAKACEKDNFRYIFEKQDSIGEIFDSFNIALTRIEEYGED